VPTGGDLLFVGNIELRVRSPVFPDLVQWTFFNDVGQVWNRSRNADDLSSLRKAIASLRSTPGVGVRVFTPFGAVRVDVGYNIYDRPSGPAYFVAPVSESGQAPLYCVSPGNTLPVTDADPGDQVPPAQASGECDESFRPPSRDDFVRRLNFNFSIGQAF
jgi:outer membrane protein insertion porin family/translocation and assembly module TamA